MTKKFLIIFSILISYVLGFFFLFSDKVSAEEIPQFKENGYQEITTELIEQIIDNNNLDLTFNDAYLLVAYLTSNNQKYYHLVFFNSKNMKNGVNYINSKNNFTFVGADIFNVQSTFLQSNSVLYKSNDTWMFGLTSKLPEEMIYYSTIDVYDEKGDVFFKGENHVPSEPSEPVFDGVVSKEFLDIANVYLYVFKSCFPSLVFILSISFGVKALKKLLNRL